jgi:hypothetical protein
MSPMARAIIVGTLQAVSGLAVCTVCPHYGLPECLALLRLCRTVSATIARQSRAFLLNTFSWYLEFRWNRHQ